MWMPWKIRSVVEERLRFVALAREKHLPLAELVRTFGISRKTAYKWLARYEEAGINGCHDRSRAPISNPKAFSSLVVKRFLALKKSFRLWGPKKLLVLYEEKYPRAPRPAIATATRWLQKAGLVKRRHAPRRPYQSLVRSKLTRPRRPNHVWCVDFKGEFKLRNGQYCWPLTVTDAYSRYLLACVALPSTHAGPVMLAFEKLFKRFGLPEVIRSDNGTPFATDGIYGLTVVSARWVRYGIIHERTPKGRPDGRHERFHRTLKEATALPPQGHMEAQQRVFDKFRTLYNRTRPHESLEMRRPDDVYQPSRRPKPPLVDLCYPAHFYSCRANRIGYLRIDGRPFFIGNWACREVLALEEIKYRRFRIHYANQVLGELDATLGTIISYGKLGGAGRPRHFDARHSHATATPVPRAELAASH